MSSNSNKVKRIGVLTFHFGLNPGSALQAYSLCKTVGSLGPGIECEVVNYQKKDWLWNKCCSPGSNVLKTIPHYLYNWFSTVLFQNFEKKNIHGGGHRVVNRSQLFEIDNKYSYFIVGSDQVWNTKSLPYIVDDTYFLDFCKESHKKIAYAASIGLSDFPEADKPRLKRFLEDFGNISVREPQAQIIIEKLIGRKPELVIDPTLLLDKTTWSELAILPKMEDYIFLYLRHRNSEIVPYARAMAKKFGLRIVEYHMGSKKIYSDDKLLIHPQPLKWLGWLLQAKYVFTDSFHGSIFCINLNKQFFVRISSANSEMSSRIYSILERYGLNDRLVIDEAEMFAKPEIDFSKSNHLLEKDREFALNYLKTALDIK